MAFPEEMMKSVLFVCTANICRSPMAMALFRDMVKDRADFQEWRIESAGTWAKEGFKASPFTLAVMSDRGLSLIQHRSRIVSQEMLNSFNLILTMENGQKESLQVEFPQIRQRVYLLSEVAGRSRDTKDPIGLPMDEYQMTADEIEGILRKGLETIVNLASM